MAGVTVIVGAQTSKHGVVMACDSQISAGWEKMRTSLHQKIWVAGSSGQESFYLVGGSGTLRPIQAIRHFTDWPIFRPDEDDDIERFAVRRLGPALKKAVADAGAMETLDGCEYWPATLMIAWDDHLIIVDGDRCVTAPSENRCAIGSGYAEALGSLGDSGTYKKADVIEAARRSTVTARGVSGPIHVADTKTMIVEEIGADA